MKKSHKNRVRHLQKVVLRKLEKDQATLKVVKNDEGFQVGGLCNDGVLRLFGPIFDLQKDAIAFGLEISNQKPKRLMKLPEKLVA